MSLKTSEWIQSATIRYDCCIRGTLEWMLDRPSLGNGLLNTKVDPIGGADYDYRSGMRGPDFTYGWIHGRVLEALVTFARQLRNIDPHHLKLLRWEILWHFPMLVACIIDTVESQPDGASNE